MPIFQWRQFLPPSHSPWMRPCCVKASIKMTHTQVFPPWLPGPAVFWDFHFIFSPLTRRESHWLRLRILASHWLLRILQYIRMLAICGACDSGDTWLTPDSKTRFTDHLKSLISYLYFRQQLPRKRHIGNDIVTVVFQVSTSYYTKYSSVQLYTLY